MKKLLLLVPAAVLLWAAPASAHTPTVTADCRTLSVDLTDYEKGTVVTITVDGKSSSDKFTGDFHQHTPWNAAVAHEWLVRVDNRGDGKSDEWDILRTGTTTPCVPPTTAPTTTYGPPKVEAFNPTPPPCVLDGRYDANRPECAALASPVMNPPAVETRTVAPVAHTEAVLAFTGSKATERAGLAVGLIGVGIAIAFAGRRFGKAI